MKEEACNIDKDWNSRLGEMSHRRKEEAVALFVEGRPFVWKKRLCSRLCERA
jgi:hypothetical protein